MRIGFYNHKGGVGKTSLCCHAGFKAIEKGIKLCVYDADRQMNTMSLLSGNYWNNEPYFKDTVYVTQFLTESEEYEFVLIDCPPAFEIVDSIKCDIWIIPVDGRFSVDGCMNIINEIKTKSPDSRIIVVVNKALNNKFGKTELKEIGLLDIELYRFPIPMSDLIRKSELMGVPIWKIPYSSRSIVTSNLEFFAEWVVNGCSRKSVYMPSENKDDFYIRSK